MCHHFHVDRSIMRQAYWQHARQLPKTMPARSCSISIRRAITSTIAVKISAPIPPKPRSSQREYFYHIDVHGLLFLHETKHRIFTTSFKDKKFLDFFFSRLQYNDLNDTYKENGFGFVSPCGPEMNYVEVEDAPIVFHDLTADDTKLMYAGTKSHPLDPSCLYMSLSSGRLYHPLPGHLDLAPLWQRNSSARKDMPQLGLLKSSLVLGRFFGGLDVDREAVTWEGQEYKLNFI
ncbi:hypothetical protein DFS34DRAFT_15004 [Phlyctochytrium arcticum]|nr:hypothetical protein DFS34DRAFT_15004 [Phlyctochytrium arcticum]